MKLVIVGFTTLFVGALLVGQVVGRTAANQEDSYKQLGVFVDVMSRIKSEYVEEPDMNSVTLGAVTGLLESIDPFASYLNGEQYKQYLQNKDTKRADLGLVLSRRFGYISVVDAIPGSPGEKGGLGTGDILETIGGVSTRDMPLAYADLLLQGAPGSEVELTVLQARKPEATKTSLTRAMVKYPAVTAKLLPDGVGHLQLQTLEPGKAREVAAALADLQKQGAKKLVLDLRNAAAGKPDEGIAIANLFLEKGVIASLEGQRISKQVFEADAAKAVWKLPVAFITNRGTAGGAEIVASALLDNKRAEVIGERTYGDAAKREAITLPDGTGAVILATAKYHAPKGKAIQETPVTPTHPLNEVDPFAGQEDEDEAAPAAPKPEVKKPEGDPLLKKAIEVLNGAAKALKNYAPVRVPLFQV
jgi:carboxyl-terminal processing protease